MATCKDCIHERVCENLCPKGLLPYHSSDYPAETFCLEFKPTADVVEVVKCEECKYKEDCARQMVHTTRDYVLEQNISSYNNVDFCSYGEKRSEGK